MTTKHPLAQGFRNIMIKDVPSYGNKLFYSLGFLSMISFALLVVTGTIMTFFGPIWWLSGGSGEYIRSVHLWATQAFVIFIVLHLLVVFFTSGFKKPRRLTWAIGVLMLFIVLAETEFGYVLRGDFSSQWRSLQGADFYNGSGLGWLINTLNYKQIYGIHIVVIPLVIIGLLFLHYLLVRILGIAKPYRKDVVARTVPANHKVLFIRGGMLITIILSLALLLPSPYISPTTIQSVATQAPNLMKRTLIAEFTNSSDTATYRDNIAPYTYNTRVVYIEQPYKQYVHPGQADSLKLFNEEPAVTQAVQLKEASDYFSQDTPDPTKQPSSPVISIVNSLTAMAAAGLYEPSITGQNDLAGNSTYAIRFLADTGILENQAMTLGVTTDQYGMVREETGAAPGAWWLIPIGVLNHTVLVNDGNGDRDAAIIFGSLILTMLAFPFIPFVNQLPDKLKVYKLIWRKKRQ